MTPSSPVLIAGAGIAGLTAALALAKCGFEVHVLERAPRLEEVGAGLQLSPNALRVLQALDLLPAVRRNAVEAASVTLKRLSDGHRLATVLVRGRDGLPYLSLLRADLQRALAEAVDRHPAIRLDLGAEIVGLRRDGSDVLMTLAGTAGPDIRTSILIAADGVRSSVGRLLGLPAERASGDVAWRAMSRERPKDGEGIRAWLGWGRHAVAYPVDGGQRTNLVLILPEGRSDREMDLRNTDPELRRLLEGAESPTLWPIATAHRAAGASDPAAVLFIGDAAHAMEPYAAQGAALAIEDGFVAALCIAEAKDIAEAQRRFASERYERWRKVRRRVAFHRFVYHLPPILDRARDLAMTLRSGPALSDDLGWLYDWKPPER